MHVKVGFFYANGDEFSDEDESVQMVIQHFEVKGRWICSEVAMLRNFGPFLCLFLSREIPQGEDAPYILRSIGEVLELADELEPNDWLDAIELSGQSEVTVTDESTLCLPVSSIEWVALERELA